MNQFKIPKDWELKKISEITERRGGGTPTKNMSEYYGGNIPWITVSDLPLEFTTLPIIEDSTLKITERAIKESSAKIIPKDSVVVATRVGLGKIGISGKEITTNQDFNSFICTNQVLPKYLAYYFIHLKPLIISKSRGVSVKGIQVKELDDLVILLPSLSTQKKIVQKLDYIFKQLEVKKEEITNINKKNIDAIKFFQKNLNRSISQYYIPMKIPPSWKTKKLSELTTVGQGGTPSTSKTEYWDGEIPWLSSGELLDNIITGSRRKITEKGLDNSSTKLCPKGTIMIAMTGQGLTRGRTGLLAIESCANQSCAHIINKSPDILTEFLWAFLKSRYWFIRSIHHGSGQPGINVSILKQLDISFPTITEQKEILKKLKSEKTIESWKSQLEVIQKNSEFLTKKLEQITSSILDTVFSGKLVN